MLLNSRTTNCFGYLEGDSFFGLPGISLGSYSSLTLFVCSMYGSGAVSLVRSLQVSATTPEGGHDRYFLIFSFSFTSNLFVSLVPFCFLCFFVCLFPFVIYFS